MPAEKGSSVSLLSATYLFSSFSPHPSPTPFNFSPFARNPPHPAHFSPLVEFFHFFFLLFFCTPFSLFSVHNTQKTKTKNISSSLRCARVPPPSPRTAATLSPFSPPKINISRNLQPPHPCPGGRVTHNPRASSTDPRLSRFHRVPLAAAPIRAAVPYS